MQKTKKILSALLALVMVIGIMPAAAFASPCELEEHTHGEGCYTLTCELSEHSHTACDLSCDKVAHTHCYDDKCEIEAHKHTACDLSCDKEAHAHCYTFTCEKAEHKHNEECAEEEVVYVAQIGTTQYETLQAAADVGGSIKLLADVTESVVVAKDATIDLNGFDVISAGDAFEITAGTLTIHGTGVVAGGSTGVGSWTAIWANGGKAILNGGTYAVGGDSSTTDVTHQNDVIYTKNGGSVVINGGYFENDGTVWTLNENDANRGTIVVYGGTFQGWNPADNVSEGANTNFVAEGYESVKNGDNYVVSKIVETPVEPEEPATPDIDPDARCGKYEHKHNACDLSCKLYAHTHCHGDTCKIEEHKHIACDLSCDKVEHTHCYPATEAPEEPEEPEEPVIPELPKPEEIDGYELNCETPAHKHTACDLSCPYDAHEHCFSDTCKIEAHVHNACDLSCDKDVHVHCYTKIESEQPETPEEPEEPVIPELPKPEEVDGYELNCDKGAHKHTACDLSCPYDEHTHCFSDTCEIEEHKHTACTLACDKAEHTHCYTKIETEDPETPDEPEVPGDDEEDIIYISKLEVEVTAPAVGEAPVFDIESLNMDVDADLGDVYVDWLFNDVADLEDLDWDYMYDDDVFEAGKYYAATVEIYMPEGVEMAEDFEATLNGVDFDYAIFMEADEEYDASFYGVFVFDDLIDAEEPEDPEEPETPDAPVVPNVEGYQTKCAKEEHKHTACDLSCDKEAHTHCFSDKCEKDHEHCYVKIEEEPEAPEYSIITGANGTWKDSSADGMIFASDAEFADFVSVKVDGAAIEATNYDAKEGSTVITLKNAYLKTLKEGEHTLTIVSKDGEASTKFTIEHEHKLTKVEAKKETCVDKGNSEYYTCECGKWFKDDKAETEIVDKTSVEIKAAGHKAATEWSRDAKSHWHKCTVCKEAADEKVAHNFDKETGKICQTCKYDVDNPKTGSEAHISAMAIIMTMSVVVMAGVAAYFVWDKKRKN